ncbi:MAG TPA: PQQ-dependent dehydrogenase, methanol/ethanol family [Longimicrobiaceae bacterium]|jgi:alcohol dehydrogenase (cytochrome c)
MAAHRIRSRLRGERGSLARALCAGGVAAALAACGPPDAPGLEAAFSAGAPAAPGPATRPDGRPLAQWAGWGAADDGEWTMQARDYASTRYSGLDEITAANAATLEMAWSFSDGTDYGHEGAPLVAGSTMYVVTPYPNVAYALDLTKPGAPIKWKFEPNPAPMAVGKACCDAVNRGWHLADGKLIYNLLDAHTVAVDTATGREVWRTKMASVEDGVTMTMAPLVVRDRVLVGNSGGEMGAHGWLAALDVKTGRELWRAHSTGPDSVVRIGADFRPFYAWMRGRDLGATTWPGDAWRHGGGAVWGWLSYDPELDLVYHGTSNPGPWNNEQRAGANLWTNAVFARDPDTGMAKWAFVFTPHDEWDYDGVNENLLADLRIGGRLRRTLVQFNRNGFAYTIDRATGEVLVAKPYVHVNWATGLDPRTMQPRVVDAKRTAAGRWVRDICPAQVGGKDQQPAAFSPRTGLFYVPAQNVCMDYITREVSYIAGTPYWGADVRDRAGPGGNWGEFIAWDAATGTKLWGIKEKFLVYSGVLVTGGDVAFYGTVDGWFRAVDARSGRVLWSRKLGSGIIGAPMTYRGPDGHQYVAVYSGVGGGGLLMDGVEGSTARGNTLYVFALRGTTPAVPEAPMAPAAAGRAR